MQALEKEKAFEGVSIVSTICRFNLSEGAGFDILATDDMPDEPLDKRVRSYLKGVDSMLEGRKGREVQKEKDLAQA